ncbi:MAG: hypothetical protein Q9162_005502 [Coniocarpon cinnabarinum]
MAYSSVAALKDEGLIACESSRVTILTIAEKQAADMGRTGRSSKSTQLANVGACIWCVCPVLVLICRVSSRTPSSLADFLTEAA